jgi:hypothetical protein
MTNTSINSYAPSEKRAVAGSDSPDRRNMLGVWDASQTVYTRHKNHNKSFLNILRGKGMDGGIIPPQFEGERREAIS